MSRTRIDRAISIIKFLERANSFYSRRLQDAFDDAKQAISEDPKSMFKKVEVIFKNEKCVIVQEPYFTNNNGYVGGVYLTPDDQLYKLSPLQLCFNGLDCEIQKMFYDAAVKSNTLEKFDEQVTECFRDIDVDASYMEYDRFYTEYNKIYEDDEHGEPVILEPVKSLGAAQKNYERRVWDDLLGQSALSPPAYAYVVSGVNLSERYLTGTATEIGLGIDYYVLVSDDAEGAPVLEATNLLPPDPTDVLFQRDRLIANEQARIHYRQSFFNEAQNRIAMRARAAMAEQEETNKENIGNESRVLMN